MITDKDVFLFICFTPRPRTQPSRSRSARAHANPPCSHRACIAAPSVESCHAAMQGDVVSLCANDCYDSGSFCLELLVGDIQRVSFSFQVNQYRGAHAATVGTYGWSVPGAVRSRHPSGMLGVAAHLICKARVPRMRARSYLVMYFVVVRSALSASLSYSSVPKTSTRASPVPSASNAS